MVRHAKKLAIFGVAALAALAAAVLGQREHQDPASCPAGLLRFGARCCGIGQHFTDGRCSGRATQCAITLSIDPLGHCVSETSNVAYAGGSVNFGVTDWQGAAPAHLQSFSVAAFALDRFEVTNERWLSCVAARKCPSLPAALAEPGVPIRNVSPQLAERFCAFANGRLPTSREWLFAAAGHEARRFPWGNTGLVCRRAAFGLVQGPCARAGTGPEVTGARPDGATPEGIVDLAGNVAEWTVELDGSFRARGGSYLSKVAAELKTWSEEVRSSAADHVGFRCAYGPRGTP